MLYKQKNESKNKEWKYHLSLSKAIKCILVGQESYAVQSTEEKSPITSYQNLGQNESKR